jgi:HD-GYP domain-containing protein (c-di-GMP phosphodiesterase class II)
MDELRRGAGTQFDPAVVEAFVRTLAEAARPEPRLELIEGGDPAAAAGAAVR